MLIGHQKGRDTKENRARNFGMPKPEGYRKALRLMKIAPSVPPCRSSRSSTPRRVSRVGAEERSQSEAIARNLFEMARLGCRSSAVIGEGGSAARSRSVWRPPADAAVLDLFGDLARGLRLDPVEERGQEELAAEAMGITADGSAKLGLVDEVCASRWAARIANGGGEEISAALVATRIDELLRCLPGCPRGSASHIRGGSIPLSCCTPLQRLTDRATRPRPAPCTWTMDSVRNRRSGRFVALRLPRRSVSTAGGYCGRRALPAAEPGSLGARAPAVGDRRQPRGRRSPAHPHHATTSWKRCCCSCCAEGGPAGIAGMPGWRPSAGAGSCGPCSSSRVVRCIAGRWRPTRLGRGPERIST